MREGVKNPNSCGHVRKRKVLGVILKRKCIYSFGPVCFKKTYVKDLGIVGRIFYVDFNFFIKIVRLRPFSGSLDMHIE